MDAARPQSKQDNLLVSLLCNLLLPSFILMKGGKYFSLSPTNALVVALLFPIGYFVYDLARRRTANFVSIVGFVAILSKGMIGVMQLSKDLVAWNEAILPLIIGTAVLVTLKAERPLIHTLLYNEQIFDVEKIKGHLAERGTESEFGRLLRTCTFWIAASFLLSAILNFVLARVIIQSETNTPEFNEELGRMNLLSWPVIVVPSLMITLYALMLLTKGLERLTGLKWEELMHEAPKKN